MKRGRPALFTYPIPEEHLKTVCLCATCRNPILQPEDGIILIGALHGMHWDDGLRPDRLIVGANQISGLRPIPYCRKCLEAKMPWNDPAIADSARARKK